MGQERLRIAPDGQVVLDLRRRWADGTTQLVFDPVEFLERLAALVPRPRINLILYYGVLAPRAAWRQAVVPTLTDDDSSASNAALAVHMVVALAAAPTERGPNSWSAALASTSSHALGALGG